jgi:hypothetical protein
MRFTSSIGTTQIALMVVATAFLSPGIAVGLRVPAYWPQKLMINRIAVAAVNEGTHEAAMSVLRDIAEGRHPQRSDGGVASLLTDDEANSPFLKELELRQYAIAKLGEIGTEEVILYLRHFDEVHSGTADRAIRGGAQVAFQKILLSRISDPFEQIALLESSLGDGIGSSGFSGGAVERWAMDELCNRGTIRALPNIERALRTWYGPTTGGEEFQFCEGRMQIVNSDTDQTRALESALRVSKNTKLSHRLLYWAVGRLQSLDSADSNAALNRFARRLLAVPASDPDATELQGLGRRLAGPR